MNALRHSLILALGLAAGGAKAKLTARLDPNPILVGERGQLVLASDTASPRLKSLPKIPGLVWLSKNPATGHKIKIINFEKSESYTASYSFRVRRQGEIKLPALQVNVGGRTHTLKPMLLKALRSGLGARDLFYSLAYDGKPEAPAWLYPGQALELECKLHIAQKLEIDKEHFGQRLCPKLELTNVSFREYPGQNPYNRRFRLKEGSSVSSGARYYTVSYKVVVLPIESGRVMGDLTHAVPVVVRSKKRSRDPFLEFFHERAKVVWQPLEKNIPAIKVVPLPKLTDPEAHDLGLIGEFDVKLTLDKQQVRAGEDLTLLLKIKGKGNFENLRPLKLDLPGFNVYDPKVERAPAKGTGSIQWVLVPKHVASRLPELKLAAFSLARDAWQIDSFRPELEVLPGEHQRPGPGNGSRPPTAMKAKAPDNALGYMRSRPSAWLRLPLWRNAALLWFCLLLFGPLGYVLVWRLKTGQLNAERRRLRKDLAKVLRELQKAQPEEVPELVSAQVLPYLRARCDLPPGTTLTTLAEKLDDPELLELLEAAEHSAFTPGPGRALDRDGLLKKLEALGALALIAGLALPLFGLSKDEPYLDAAANYEQGKFAEAAYVYRQELQRHPGKANANLYYNLGNCAYMQENYGKALLCFERARRLAPRDKGIAANRKLTWEKLGVSRKDKILAGVRDLLRPDEWLTLAGLAWLCGWLLLAGCRWCGRKWHPLLILPFLALLICLGAWQGQRANSYRPDLALVVKSTSLHRLPQVVGTAGNLLQPGSEVRIVEERRDWVRVRLGRNEGWVEKTAIGRLFPQTPEACPVE